MDFDLRNFMEVAKNLLKTCTELGVFTWIKKRFRAPEPLPAQPPPPQRRKSDLVPVENRLPPQSYDRRKGSLEDRLTEEIWNQFHRKTGYGKTQLIDEGQRGNLIRAFVEAGTKYQFSERGSETLLMPSTIAKPAATVAIQKLKDLTEKHRMAIILVEDFTNEVLSNFNVVSIDRRQGPKHHTMAG
jgi:hypothetical protein